MRPISSKVISMAEQNRILFIDKRYHKENNHKGSNCPFLKLVRYLTQKMVRNLKKNMLYILIVQSFKNHIKFLFYFCIYYMTYETAQRHKSKAPCGLF